MSAERPTIVRTIRAPLPVGADGRAERDAKPQVWRPGDEAALELDVSRDTLLALQSKGMVRGFFDDDEVEAFEREREAARQAALAEQEGEA